MAAAAILAELKFPDGRAQKVQTVNVPVEGTLPSLMEGLHKVSEKVSLLLNELVAMERLAGDGGELDDEEDGEDDADSSDGETEEQVHQLPPPVKKAKT
ncbi:uncharacterized protein si:dkeyp-55f12.3 [Corythoichthys intestinalis]|uniref:uncharacterized protein si:dkeyp-55f12.3 n=1 Tax=Corythoichthys intestinalis TaxID=161448 RepID=UPI0025A62893|nr:uncharacterized protein si:dkeyp-55f12.3 [Corythoichthys intestinalis]